MAQLARLPGMPTVLEGVLNLGGTAVPVIRLNRLLGLADEDPGLYAMLIVLRHSGCALLAERTIEIHSVSELLPLRQEDSFNACAEASFSFRGELVPLLSPQRILLEKETRALSEFQVLAERRVQEWGAANL